MMVVKISALSEKRENAGHEVRYEFDGEHKHIDAYCELQCPEFSRRWGVSAHHKPAIV
jgi:hypothetical protein